MYRQYFTTAVEKFLHVYILVVVVVSLKADITNAELGLISIDITEAPYMVQIVDKRDIFLCSGTILSQQHVILPAHCALNGFYAPEDMRVIANSTYLKSEAQMLAIETAFVHPEYDTNTLVNNVAVLKMKEPFVFGKGLEQVSGICSSPIKDGVEIQISGWGCNQYGHLSTDLKSIRTNSLVCAPKIKSEITSRFCESFANVKNKCNRIIDGPVMSNNKLCGMVYWTRIYRTNKPAVFIDITKATDFISRAQNGDTDLPYFEL